MTKDLFVKEKEIFIPTYKRIPIDVEKGEGIYLYSKSGERYSDFFSGIAVNALGYSHPKIIEAVTNQLKKFTHLSNSYVTDIQIEFSELLLKHSGMKKIFLTNSGTEAIEGAIKLIRKHSGENKTILSFSNSFHGRTYGALSLTAREKYRKGFEPLLPNIKQIEFNNINELLNSINENSAAVFLEFIQGEGGINIASNEFIEELDKLHKKYNFILVADSIQCGIGRTGKPFSHNYYNIKPDIIVTAKAIGGGFPLGAFLVNEKYSDVLTTGIHGTTFGGNPVCCAAGKVVLEEVFENGLMEKVLENGNYFISELTKIAEKYTHIIKEVRGRGFMIGVELFVDGDMVNNKFFDNKVLLNCTNGNVLRILPSLITTKEQIDEFIIIFNKVIEEV